MMPSRGAKDQSAPTMSGQSNGFKKSTIAVVGLIMLASIFSSLQMSMNAIPAPQIDALDVAHQSDNPHLAPLLSQVVAQESKQRTPQHIGNVTVAKTSEQTQQANTVSNSAGDATTTTVSKATGAQIDTAAHVRKGKALTTKIIAFCDYRYREYGLRWYRKLAELGYNQHELITMDEQTYEYFQQEGDVRCSQMPYPFCTGRKITHGGRTQREYRRQLFPRRWMYIHDLLQNETDHVLLTDVDNHFMSFFDVEKFASTDRDMFLAYETAYPQDVYFGNGFVTCGGMSWMRGDSDGVKRLVQTVLKKCGCLGDPFPCKTCTCDDQVVWNRMIWKSKQASSRRSYMVLWDDESTRAKAASDAATTRGAVTKTVVSNGGDKATITIHPALSILPQADAGSKEAAMKYANRENFEGSRLPAVDNVTQYVWRGRTGVVTVYNETNDGVPSKAVPAEDVIAKVAVWDKDFAFRAAMPKHERECPMRSVNWVTMPVLTRKWAMPGIWHDTCKTNTSTS